MVSTNNKQALLFYKLVPVSDFQISSFIENFYTPYGSFSERYASKFGLGEKLYYEKEKWDGSYANLWCWHTHLPIPKGPWNIEVGIYQIGIRKKVDGVYKYGWITIKYVSIHEIYFVNYALEK